MQTTLINKNTIQLLCAARRLNRDEIIQLGDYHSLDEGFHVQPLMNIESVGECVSEYSEHRSFWRPIPTDPL